MSDGRNAGLRRARRDAARVEPSGAPLGRRTSVVDAAVSGWLRSTTDRSRSTGRCDVQRVASGERHADRRYSTLGGGTASRIERTIASGVMPSASPSKFRITRCRSAGRATARMSSMDDVEPAVEERVDLARGHERLGAARRAAVADVVADELRRAGLVRVRGRQERDGVGRDVRRDRHGAGEPLHLDDLGRARDLAGRRRLGAGRPIHDQRRGPPRTGRGP